MNSRNDSSSDTWATLVTHITGYPVPDRNTVFDTLRSDHGGKLFRMDIKERGLGLIVKDSGFLTNKGEDYDIWFFNGGKKSSIMQARIVFEGRVKVGDEVVFAGPGSDNVNDAQVREGNEFTDYNKDKMSTIPLARYMNGPRAALLELLTGNTQNARFSNLGVPGADVVDLSSFTRTGESFDFAAKFFKDYAPVLKDWEDRFGRDDASWKGEAAEVFRSLLKKIRENYDSYVETFNTAVTGDNTGAGATVYSRALSLGRKYLEEAARELLNAWLAWAKSPYYDPHRVLRYVLDELAQWVNDNNVMKTEIKASSTRYSTRVYHSPKEGFTQVHPEYGDLTDVANWAKVGDKAVKIWNRGVDKYLGEPAAKVQSTLNNHFLDLGKDFSGNIPEPKSTGTASEDYEKRKLKEEKDEINRQNEENKKYQDELREEQRRQREEDKKYQDELREEQNRQREEDKKYQDELREEQNRQREEDKKYQDELREEQNRQREEDKKYQEELRKEAEREAEEQRASLEDSLGGLNDPTGVGEQNLNGLDDLLNQRAFTTESPGDLNDVNALGGSGEQGSLGPVPNVQNLGNLGGLNNARGGTDNSVNDAINQNLGSLGNLNGTGGALKTPTGGSTRLDDGKLTTAFPDGSSTSFDPDNGVLTTTHPDGSVTTQNLGDGVKVTNPDGSVTSLGDDGKLTTTFPDGSVQKVDPATGRTTTTDPDGRTVTENLGDLGNINGGLGGGDGVLDTPTGGSTQLTSGGDVTTDFPGGGGSTFDPDKGLLTTTHPDGSVTTQNLGDGVKVTNPDGSVTSLGDDGKLTTTFPDGSVQKVDPATGRTTTTDPDGRTVTENLGDLGNLNGRNSLGDLGNLGDLGDLNPDLPTTESIGDLGDLGDLNGGRADGLETPTGGHTAYDDGDFTTTFADGGKATFDPDNGMLTTTRPDGTTTVTDLTHGAKVTNPDGSQTFLDDGRLTTTFPDGSKQIIDPDTGIATITDPQGNTEKIDLRDLDSSGGKDVSDLLDGLDRTGRDSITSRDVPFSELGLGGGGGGDASSGGAGGGLSGAGALSPEVTATSGVAPLSDSATNQSGSPLQSTAGSGTPGTPGAPGTPGTPGMPMGGMGGMGAGAGGEKGNGERVRAVLVDAVEESERRNRRRRSPWHRQEDNDTFLAPASRVATTGGDSPEREAEQDNRSTSSAGYLEEDEDVWGTEEGGNPAVIGR
ncbi:AAWKG family protein [Streptomyces sp. FXY-T5]|uniref:AAWKG family protein n=1 Tax=Streptomyces sp. FXY-T5 TaxID=3064901 RepID=UPI0027D316F8|nr:AAWKG family protein [Streptomyces sp. FXY-T5]WMD04696.1 AAWKG family protein [Streptomyces sp. FXY-T5]